MTMSPHTLRGLFGGLSLLAGLGVASAQARPETPPSPKPAAVSRPAAPSPVPPAQPGKASGPKTLGELGSSREPIAIDADKLEVFDKEGRAVFSGNVVTVQGDTTMKCTVMTVLYESGRAGTQTASAEKPARPPGGGLGDDSSIRKMDCAGPVTIVTKTQTATGNRAEFDRVVNKVFLIGNAVLADGPNVTKGERVAYDLTTGVANVEGTAANPRVRTLIVPSSQKEAGAKEPPPKEKTAKPKER